MPAWAQSSIAPTPFFAMPSTAVIIWRRQISSTACATLSFREEEDAALVNRTEYTQPALFAVEYALVELLKSWGISPNAVVGHSLGEITAAWAAGVMTLEDAMRLGHRPQCTDAPNAGAMGV